MPNNLKAGWNKIIPYGLKEPLGLQDQDSDEPSTSPFLAFNGFPDQFFLTAVDTTDVANTYQIGIEDYQYTCIDGSLVVATKKEEQNQVWKIEYFQASDSYTISNLQNDRFWTLPDSMFGAPVEAAKETNPLFPQLFRFTPIEEEEDQ